MKRYTAPLLLSALLAFGSPEANAQKDCRDFPYFLDAAKSMTKPCLRTRGNRFYYIPNFDTANARKTMNKHDRLQSASGVGIVKVTQGGASKSETHIAIDPNNPKVIIGTSNDSRYNNYNSGYRMGAYYTADGGETWENSTTQDHMNKVIDFPDNGSMTIFDPTIAFDTKGYGYYLYGFTQIMSDGDTEGENGVFISRTRDGGKTWDKPFPIEMSSNSVFSNAFNDRYWMAIDQNENSPYKDRIYVTWQRFNDDPAVLLQTADAADFDTEIYPSNPKKLAKGSTQSPNPAVGPNGELYIVWQARQSSIQTDAMFTSSFDGGETFRGTKNLQSAYHSGSINSLSGRMVFDDKQGIRVSNYPSIAVDCSNSPYRGRIYVIQTGADNLGHTGVWLTYSDNKGVSWTSSQKIDENSNKDRDVFFGAITVDRETGLVAVMYYSSKDANDNSGVDAYSAVSLDGGKTWTNIRLTPESYYLDSPYKVSGQGTGNVYWGDYSGICAHGNKVYPLFWWAEDPDASFWNVDAYTALISDAPAPCEIISAGTNNSSDNPVYNYINLINTGKDLFSRDIEDCSTLILRDGFQIAKIDKDETFFEDKNVLDGQVYKYEIYSVDNSDYRRSYKAETTIAAGGATVPNTVTDVSFENTADGVILRWTNPEFHVDNTICHDLNKIDIYDGTTLIKSVTGKLPGEECEITLPLETEKFYKLNIEAVSKRNDNYTGSGKVKIFVYAGETLSELDENFDSEPLTPTYTNAWWDRTTEQSYSPNYSLTDSPNKRYVVSTLDEIIFAPVFLSWDKTNLTFRHKALIDAKSKDYAIVMVSTDQMQSWHTIKSYNSKTYASEWSGETADECSWVLENLSLEDYAGQEVYLRLVVLTDSDSNADGWYIDDLALNGETSNADETSIIPTFDLSISPNPTNGIVKAEISGLIAGDTPSLEIFDALGRRITNINANSASLELDLSGNPAGCYFAILRSGKSSVIKPIILEN